VSGAFVAGVATTIASSTRFGRVMRRARMCCTAGDKARAWVRERFATQIQWACGDGLRVRVARPGEQFIVGDDTQEAA
jgi:hypothetical protein